MSASCGAQHLHGEKDGAACLSASHKHVCGGLEDHPSWHRCRHCSFGWFDFKPPIKATIPYKYSSSENNSTIAAVLILLTAILMVVFFAFSPTHAGECPAQELKTGEALDHECRLFRVVKEDNERWIEVSEHKTPGLAVWHRTEKINCSKAVDIDGAMVYQAHTVAANFYCGPIKEKR